MLKWKMKSPAPDSEGQKTQFEKIEKALLKLSDSELDARQAAQQIETARTRLNHLNADARYDSRLARISIRFHTLADDIAELERDICERPVSPGESKAVAPTGPLAILIEELAEDICCLFAIDRSCVSINHDFANVLIRVPFDARDPLVQDTTGKMRSELRQMLGTNEITFTTPPGHAGRELHIEVTNVRFPWDPK